MSSEALVQLAQLSTVLMGFLGIAVALRSHRRQMNAQMFVEFSARFESLIRSLPSHAWLVGADPNVPMPPPSDELTRCSLRCFHLLADLYHLHKGGYISHDLWRPWRTGIERTLKNPVLRREWCAVEGIFSHYPEFCRYVRRSVGPRPDAQFTTQRDGEHLWH